MSLYYELKGKLRQAALAVLEERERAHAQALDLARMLGANTTVYGDGRIFGFKFDPKAKPKPKEPDLQLLKPYYNNRTKSREDWYVPNGKTKEGKALQKQLREIRLPGADDITGLMKLNRLYYGGRGLSFFTPGIRVWGPRKRVMIILPDLPPKSRPKESNQLVRVSDVQFERLAKRYKDRAVVDKDFEED